MAIGHSARRRWSATARARRTSARANPLVRFQHGFEQRFDRVRDGYRSAVSPWRWSTGMRFVVGFLGFVLALVRPGAVPGQQFLPLGRCRRDDPSCARADRDPHRGNRRAVRPCRDADPPERSRQPSWTPSSTISACRSAASTAPISTPAASARRTATSYISLNREPPPTADYVQQAADGAAAQLSRARPSPSCRPTSSARS